MSPQSARKVDERVAREIEIAIKTGVLVNSRNESSHRLARTTTRQSTTIRKSRESRELTEERARIQMEIDAVKKNSAARLKELQALKTATGKPRKSVKTTQPRSVFVSADSSGRVKTATIGISFHPVEFLHALTLGAFRRKFHNSACNRPRCFTSRPAGAFNVRGPRDARTLSPSDEWQRCEQRGD